MGIINAQSYEKLTVIKNREGWWNEYETEQCDTFLYSAATPSASVLNVGKVGSTTFRPDTGIIFSFTVQCEQHFGSKY